MFLQLLIQYCDKTLWYFFQLFSLHIDSIFWYIIILYVTEFSASSAWLVFIPFVSHPDISVFLAFVRRRCIWLDTGKYNQYANANNLQANAYFVEILLISLNAFKKASSEIIYMNKCLLESCLIIYSSAGGIFADFRMIK